MQQPRTILQWGTGRFLRAFVDLFAHELNASERPFGGVVAVQSTGSDRAELLRKASEGFPVLVRGIDKGRIVSGTVRVESVIEAWSAQDNWPEVVSAAVLPELTTIVSNGTEAAYAVEVPERVRLYGDLSSCTSALAPKTLPGKMAAVLFARFKADLPMPLVLPCELLDDNSRRLRKLTLESADFSGGSSNFLDWLSNPSAWRSTLVDRIVSQPTGADLFALSGSNTERGNESALDLAAVAEPFALWLIEKSEVQDSAEHDSTAHAWSEHPSVHQVESLASYALRKVRILNGAHTALVAYAMPRGCKTVREAIETPDVRDWLERLLFEEILPVLGDRVEDGEAFANDTLERFGNPFLEHRLEDIALYHDEKLRTRLLPTLLESQEASRIDTPLLNELFSGRN
jgi:tagaturonate reductase